MKALVGAYNQEKAVVGAFSVITNLRMELFEALELRLPGTGDLVTALLSGWSTAARLYPAARGSRGTK